MEKCPATTQEGNNKKKSNYTFFKHKHAFDCIKRSCAFGRDVSENEEYVIMKHMAHQKNYSQEEKISVLEIPSEVHTPTLLKLFIKTSLLTLVFLLVFFLLTLIGLGIYAKSKVDSFTTAAGISFDQAISLAKEGWRTQPLQSNHRINFLILGTDELDNRGHSVQLTDSMVIGSLNLQNGQVNLLSLPRDLWLEDYQTKINALYQYGKDKYPTEPQRFPREVLEQLVGTPLHHTIIINLDTLASLIDTMDGIDIHVKESFIDTEFPRSDVDVTKVHDPKLLYKTVEFHEGVEHMNGQRVLEYVRSRHSSSEQGNDVARGQRQQEVILEVINALKNPNFFRDTARTGRLYRFYQDHFAQYLPITELIAIAKQLFPLRNTISFQSNAPSIYPENPSGVITHPPLSVKYQNQWVYIIRTTELFKKEVENTLHF